MRTEDEIRKVFRGLDDVVNTGFYESEGFGTRLLRKTVERDIGDSFKNGYLIGRMTALAWILGEDSSDVAIQYDFDDYKKEMELRRKPRTSVLYVDCESCGKPDSPVEFGNHRVHKSRDGVHHFCSPSCLEKYLEAYP